MYATRNFVFVQRVGMFIGAICHDIDHRGVNNAFLLKTEHPIGQLYCDGSVMEYHHAYMTRLVLQVSSFKRLQ